VADSRTSATGTTDVAAWLAMEEVDVPDAVPLVAAGRSVAMLPGRLVSAAESLPLAASVLPRAARVAAYALLHNADHGVLLVHAGPGTTWAGRRILPGGGAEHGEDLAETVIREVAEETGLEVVVDAVVAVTSDVVDSVPRQQHLWTVRLVCDARVVGGSLRAEVEGSSDGVRWFTPDELASTPLVPFVREVLRV